MPFSTKFIMPYSPFSTKFILPYLPFSTIFSSSLLRTDLLEQYKYFRQYGKDALLLTVLAYNVGHSRLLGYGKRQKSNLINKIEPGDRDIYKKYISYHCYKGKHRTCQRKGLRLWYISYHCYKGKPIPGIERRRKKEFQLLYIPYPLFKEHSLKQSREGYYCIILNYLSRLWQQLK